MGIKGEINQAEATAPLTSISVTIFVNNRIKKISDRRNDIEPYFGYIHYGSAIADHIGKTNFGCRDSALFVSKGAFWLAFRCARRLLRLLCKGGPGLPSNTLPEVNNDRNNRQYNKGPTGPFLLGIVIRS